MAFQVISATTSRRTTRNASGSISSLHTSETDSSDLHRPSLDFNRLSSRSRPDGYPERSNSRHQRAPSGTSTLGRRLVEKFSRSGGARPHPAGPAQSWSAPLRDQSDDSTPRPRLGRRKGSFSSLLGFGNSGGNTSEQAEKPDAPKKLLGMSLMAGRRSEDLLTTGRSGTSSRVRATRGPESRRSLDVLTDQRTRKSTIVDNLLVREKRKRLGSPARSDVANALQIVSPSEGTPSGASHQPPPDAQGDVQGAPHRPEAQRPTSLTRSATVEHNSGEFEHRKPAIVAAARTGPLGEVDAQEVPGYGPVPPAEDTTIPQMTLSAGPIPPHRHETLVQAASRQIAPPPPDVPIWRQQRPSHQPPEARAQTSMNNAWMELEEAVGRCVLNVTSGRLQSTLIHVAVQLSATAARWPTRARSSHLDCPAAFPARRGAARPNASEQASRQAATRRAVSVVSDRFHAQRWPPY